DERLALAFAPVRAAPLGLGHHARLLQRQTHEVVRARCFLLAVLAVEMLHRPTRIAIAILGDQAQHLINRRSACRYLPESQIDQTIQAVALEAPALSPKLPFRYAQKIGR